MTVDAGESRPTVLLTGATSQLGVFIIPRLIDSGYRVIAVSRKAQRSAAANANPFWLNADDLQSETQSDIHPELASTEYAISCGPLALAPRLLAQNRSIRRIIAFSTTSVWVKADSADPRERRQIREILETEKQFHARCTESGVDWLLLRPPLIYGCGRDRNISTLAGLIRRFGWLPLAGAANGLRQPVHADDLARLAVDALKSESGLSFESAACGGETLTYREMVERIFEGQQKSPRIISLPESVLVILLKLYRLVTRNPAFSPELIRRQCRDQVFDDGPVRQRLDYAPRGFLPGPGDFSVPPEAARYQP